MPSITLTITRSIRGPTADQSHNISRARSQHGTHHSRQRSNRSRDSMTLEPNRKLDVHDDTVVPVVLP